jgi:hypothetical protein
MQELAQLFRFTAVNFCRCGFVHRWQRLPAWRRRLYGWRRFGGTILGFASDIGGAGHQQSPRLASRAIRRVEQRRHDE